ncbi:uncharacterized protein [Mytilus edulis]|uniref:uncharacterized protein n=1 Tax=Mytilus edulis TaxID=6550 RepID=UPI0039F12B7E
MCTNESTVEDSTDGYIPVDSVLLRITKHQNNCICQVTLQNTVTNYTIYMSKYKDLSIAAPEHQNCGLAVDVEYLDTSDTPRPLQSIECTRGTGMRSIDLGGGELKFKSRIIDGNFTRGYCMQIYRNESINDCKMNDQFNKAGSEDDWIVAYLTKRTSSDECKQFCLQTKICVAIHYEYNNKYCFIYNQTTKPQSKDNSTYSQKQCFDTQKLKIRCYPPESTTQTSQVTTTEDTFTTTFEKETKPFTHNEFKLSTTKSTFEEKKDNIKDSSPSFVVALVIAIIGCTVAVIFAGTTVYYKRQLHTQKGESPLESSVNYVDLSVARDVSDYSAINTQVGNEQYETVSD